MRTPIRFGGDNGHGIVAAPRSPRAGGGSETIRLLVAQKVVESLFAKYMRIALAIFRKFDDSVGLGCGWRKRDSPSPA